MIGPGVVGGVENGEPRPLPPLLPLPADRFDRVGVSDGRGLCGLRGLCRLCGLCDLCGLCNPVTDERGVASGFVVVSGAGMTGLPKPESESWNGRMWSGGGRGSEPFRLSCSPPRVSPSFSRDFRKNHPNPSPVRFLFFGGGDEAGKVDVRGEGRLLYDSESALNESLSVRELIVAVGEYELDRVSLVLRSSVPSIDSGERGIERERGERDCRE